MGLSMLASRMAQGLLPWLALLWLPGTHAQWSIENDDDNTAVALVRNDSGDEFRLWRNGDGIEATLTLHQGLASMSADGCPSFRIDDHPPRVGAGEGEVCVIEGRTATFVLATAQGDEVRSAMLMEFINGATLHFIYHLEGTGYRETLFTLQGSKQSITAAIGNGVTVTDE